MRSHAVCTNPSNYSPILVILLLLVLFLPTAPLKASTLGTITALNRAAGELAIDGQVYSVDSFSEIKQKNTNDAEETAAWYSLNVGDYVIFESEGKRIRSLRRETADSLDLPAGMPSSIDSIRPAEDR